MKFPLPDYQPPWVAPSSSDPELANNALELTKPAQRMELRRSSRVLHDSHRRPTEGLAIELDDEGPVLH